MDMAFSNYDVFDNIVNKVSDKLSARLSEYQDSIKAVNFFSGHWVEISQRLQDMSKNSELKYYKFPAVFLVGDQQYDETNSQIGTTTIQLLIVASTNPDFTSDQRQQLVFKSILTPIYDELLRCIATSGYYQQRDASNIAHRRWDRLNLGKTDIYGNTGNLTADFVDAIQLQDLKLTYYKQKC